jgi:mono/diheme cytochrome c family protein
LLQFSELGAVLLQRAPEFCYRHLEKAKVAMLRRTRIDHRRCVTVGVAFAIFFCAGAVLLAAQSKDSSEQQRAGEKIYQSACVACHGADGKGTPVSISGFEQPRTFPDFTRCDQTMAEDNWAWKAVIVHGGPTRGFSQIMPSFKEALTPEEIDDVIRHLRSFCRSKKWPRGELNLPRAIATEKAYPEDEAVVSTAVNARGAPGVTTHMIHEERFGVNNQIEIDVPLTFQDQNHTWYGGVGDTTFGIKRVMFSSLKSGSIFALQGSAILPTGNRARGFGSGTTTFETFAAFDQLFKTNTFIQTQLGADLPRHTGIAPQSLFFNTALGQSFTADHGLGRAWTPMFEFLAARGLIDRAKTNWDVLPQMQVTISKRQHIRGDLGVRIPVNNTEGRPIQLMLYLLWDWQDGRLNEGW